MSSLPASAEMRALARRLLAASRPTPDPSTGHALQAFEPLRVSVARFAGTVGYTSLLRRAVSLAGAEVSSLKNVTFAVEDRLENLEAIASQAGNAEGDASVAVLTHFLVLLVTFIGEPLTLKLVREAWPDASLDE